MSAHQKKESDSAVCEIIIARQREDNELMPYTADISVDLGLNRAGMFTLEMEDYDKQKDEPNWIDNEILSLGKEVEVKMGYGNNRETIFFGDIMGINASFSSDRSPVLTVRAYDRRHRLEKQTEARRYEKMKYSDIARDIAGKSGLMPKVQDSKVVHEYVEKSNQSDLEFLEKLAREINYQVMVVGKNLLFEPVSNDASPFLTLTLEKDLMDFSADLSLALQASDVVVRGWDPAEKKEIVSQAASGSEGSKMGGKQSASQLSKESFNEAIAVVSRHPVRTRAEADQFAKARLEQMSLGLIEASGSTDGRTDLLPGKVIKVTGLGKRFSGQYYVTSATHRFDQQNGYRTNFTARRNAL